MVDQHATEHQDLSAAMHRAETQQRLLRDATSLNASAPSPISAAGKESEVTGLSGSELEGDIQGQLANIAVNINQIILIWLKTMHFPKSAASFLLRSKESYASYNVRKQFDGEPLELACPLRLLGQLHRSKSRTQLSAKHASFMTPSMN